MNDLVRELSTIASRAPWDPEYKLVGEAARAIERLSPLVRQLEAARDSLHNAETDIFRLQEELRQATKARDWYYRALEELANHPSGAAYIAQTALKAMK